ncbi:epimerase [Pseudomonas taiwanensis]|nr:NAD-dependent epimerase/dehydratase family protein [Pseudomonas taiwanensis]NWL77990.1 epimerase [Pseudomonas taiwanensis]
MEVAVHTLITGAAGFVGSALAWELLSRAAPDDTFVLTDIAFDHAISDARVNQIEGRLDDGVTLTRILDGKPDRIFHLATVAGRQSVDNFELGKSTNLDATIELLERLRLQGNCPRVVYASSVAVFSPPWGSHVDDETLPNPGISYATHKLIGELLINDYTRAGFIDGVALRLSGIVARPAGSVTMLSAFLSDVFFSVAAGSPFTLPMAPESGTWVMSLKRCVENLLHAGEVAAGDLPARRNWTLPALYLQMKDFVSALADYYGPQVYELVTCESVPQVEALFKQCPLKAPGALQLGFVGDGSVDEFVRNVILTNPQLAKR